MEMNQYQSTTSTALQEAKGSSSSHVAAKVLTAAEIQAWIVNYLADLLEIDADEVNPSIPFDRYGLDSSVAVGLTGDLEDWMGHTLDPTLLYDYPTVEKLAHHLAEEVKRSA